MARNGFENLKTFFLSEQSESIERAFKTAI